VKTIFDNLSRFYKFYFWLIGIMQEKFPQTRISSVVELNKLCKIYICVSWHLEFVCKKKFICQELWNSALRSSLLFLPINHSHDWLKKWRSSLRFGITVIDSILPSYLKEMKICCRWGLDDFIRFPKATIVQRKSKKVQELYF
jgi:hypothetical protein